MFSSRLVAGLRRVVPGRAADRLDLRRRELLPRAVGPGEVTRRLYARLSDADLASLESRLQPAHAARWVQAEPDERLSLALAYAVHYRVPGALERTGLTAAVPPDHVHAMARGAEAAGGAYYYADMVAEGLRLAGQGPGAGRRGLDFGCSSGRIVRVLAGAYPDGEWYGCDPNAEAVDWAAGHIPGVEFGVSPQDPPLAYPAEHFDFVFAVSIWSHFDEDAAVRWLREAHRVIAPGGCLLLTTHGYNALRDFAEQGKRSPDLLTQAHASLYQRGFFFHDEFGPTGDNGIASPGWGLAFFSLEWLCSQLPPDWHLIHFETGRAGGQDLVVLERR
jgi:SAM-dependent methyltransferase